MIGLIGWMLGWMWFDLRFVLVDAIWFESLVFFPFWFQKQLWPRPNQLLVLVEKVLLHWCLPTKKLSEDFQRFESRPMCFLMKGEECFRFFIRWPKEVEPYEFTYFGIQIDRWIHFSFWYWSHPQKGLLVLEGFFVVWNLFSSTMLSWTKSVQVRIYLFEDDLNDTKLRMPSIDLMN